MIYLKMRGRLGNQLFQYAFAKKISLITGDEIGIDWEIIDRRSKIEEGNYWGRELLDFNVSASCNFFEKNMNIVQRQIMSFSNKYYRNHPYVNDRKIAKMYEFLSCFRMYLYQDGYVKYKSYASKDKFIYSYCESPKYFDDIKSTLQKEFIPKHKVLDCNKELYNLIMSNESICVTVRRGDFLESQNINKLGVCSIEYYKKGVHLIQEKHPDAIVILFSDDIEWTKKNLTFDCKVYAESGKDPVWEKLRLMSACKHFVISNSTFSWWAQYLSLYPLKMVVAPDPWRIDRKRTDIVQNEWIRIQR